MAGACSRRFLKRGAQNLEKKPKVFMICGISCSGKTHFSKLLELRGIPRLSMDEELWPDYFVLSDFISDEHRDFLYEEAKKRIKSRISNFIAEGRSLSVDMPFCKRQQRNEFRAHIESCGGEPVLIWIKAELLVLKRRLAERKGKNGPNNLPVSEEEIEMFWRGFEKPDGENAVEINGEKEFDVDAILKII